MKISPVEKSILLRKYKQEGLDRRQINQRFINLEFEQDFQRYNRKKRRKKSLEYDYILGKV